MGKGHGEAAGVLPRRAVRSEAPTVFMAVCRPDSRKDPGTSFLLFYSALDLVLAAFLADSSIDFEEWKFVFCVDDGFGHVFAVQAVGEAALVRHYSSFQLLLAAISLSLV